MGNHAQHNSRHRRLMWTALATIGAAVSSGAYAQAGRDYISVVGSSTVYPFSIVVAENFQRKNPSFRTRKVKPWGTAAALKPSGGGWGSQFPTTGTASRPSPPPNAAVSTRTGSRQTAGRS